MKTSISICKNTICRYFKRMNFSFTLIELSIALSVIGILSAVGIGVYKSSNPELKKDLKKMKAIEDKLQEFFNVNGRLPFPANVEYGVSNSNYLIEKTKNVAQEPVGFNILWGIIPTRTLGLPDDYAYDSQGHNFEYITNAYIATPNGTETQSGYKKSNYITSNEGKYQVLLTATNNTSPNKSITLTGLSIYNNQTNKQIQTTADNTAYVVMSKGKTNKCFFNTRTSTSVNDNKPTGNLLKNCISNYSESSNAEITIYQGYSKEFDNIVKYRTMNDIVVHSYKADEKAQGLGSNNANTTDGYFNALPKGTMVLFYLSSNNIPQGWQICDGTNGTPDTRGYFAIGANGDGDVNKSSGNNSISISTPSHRHSFQLTANDIPNHYHYYDNKHTATTSGKHAHGGLYNVGRNDWESGGSDDGSNVIKRNETHSTDEGGDRNHTINVQGYTNGYTYIDTSGTKSSIPVKYTSDAESDLSKIYDITNKHKKIYYICKIR